MIFFSLKLMRFCWMFFSWKNTCHLNACELSYHLHLALIALLSLSFFSLSINRFTWANTHNQFSQQTNKLILRSTWKTGWIFGQESDVTMQIIPKNVSFIMMKRGCIIFVFVKFISKLYFLFFLLFHKRLFFERYKKIIKSFHFFHLKRVCLVKIENFKAPNECLWMSS